MVLTFLLSLWAPEGRRSRAALTSRGLVSSEGWGADLPTGSEEHEKW